MSEKSDKFQSKSRFGGGKGGKGQSFGGKPRRSFGDKPREDRGGRPASAGFGDKKPYKPRFDKEGGGEGRGERTFGDKPRRSFGDKPRGSFGDKPRGSFGDKKPYKPRFDKEGGGEGRGERTFGDKPRRSFGDKPRGSFGDKPRGSFGDKKPYKPRFDKEGGGEGRGERTFGDKPRRSFGDKPRGSFGDKPRGSFGDKKPYKPRFDKEGGGEGRGERTFGDKPRRSFGDKPRGSFGDKPRFDRDDRGGRPAGRSFGDKKPYKPRFDKEGGEGRGERSFGDKPRRSFGDKPRGSFGDKPRGSFGDKPRFDRERAEPEQREYRKPERMFKRYDEPRGERSAERDPASFETRQKLKSDRPGHGAPSPAFLYGVHAVTAALLNPRRMHQRLLCTERGFESIEAACRKAAEDGLKLPSPTFVDKDDIARLLPRDAVHQDVLLDTQPLEEVFLADILISAPADACVIVLDQVTDPHNVGAIIRSAAAFGAVAVVMQRLNAPEITGTLAKSASGAVEHVPMVREVNLSRAIEQMKEAGFQCIGLDERGAQPLSALKMTGRTALVMGAEGEGLRRLVAETCDTLARLPTQGPIGSLNVSNAAAISLYEIARARG